MKVLRVTRGNGETYYKNGLNSDRVTFTGKDQWDYGWFKRNFDIILYPGQTKRIMIKEVK